MPRANLKGQAELEFLRKTVRMAFESRANRTLVANTNKGNYVGLADEISEIANKKAQGTAYEKMDMTVSEGQVRSLFIESNKDFLDYFVQACYYYTQGMSREAFMGNPENQELIKTWEREQNGNIELSNGLEETQKNEIAQLQNCIKILKNRYKRFVILTILGLITALSFFYFYQKNTQSGFERLNVWTGNKGEIQKDELLTHLDFLQPNSGFMNVVDTIIQSLKTPSLFYNKETALPIVFYKNIVPTSGYKKYNNTYYPDQISIIPFHGFTEMNLDSAVFKAQGMASYLYKLYSHASHQNGETYIKKDILAKIMRLAETDFDVDLIYLGYKEDIQNIDSQDFMLRYPPYKLDESDLQSYIMVNRQWWREAMLKTGIHWQQVFNGQNLYCGISKSYPTVRIHAPNQRTFWVEILPNPDNQNTRMVLAIDLILKE